MNKRHKAATEPTSTIIQYKINNVNVTPVIPDGGEPDAKKIKGYDFIPTLYSNIFLCAKKKSGKTNLIFTLLEQLCTKDTEVFVFSSTFHKDKTYDALFRMLDKKKIIHEEYMSFLDDDGLIIQEILHEGDAAMFHPVTVFRGPKFWNDPKNNKKPSSGALGPEKIFIFDDLGTDLRHPVINQLLKTNRHYKCKVILSSQYLHDLQPQAIKQLDYVFLFKSFSDDKLMEIYKLLDLSISYEQFSALYKFATMEPYSFLYVDVRNNQFRKNFNILLDIADFTDQ